MPKFGKRTPFTVDHLQPFVEAYGDDAHGGSPRKDQGETGRVRCFPREEIAARRDNLDISWLKDENADTHRRFAGAGGITGRDSHPF
jgi:type I restriction enzyme M protein